MGSTIEILYSEIEELEAKNKKLRAKNKRLRDKLKDAIGLGDEYNTDTCVIWSVKKK